MAIEELELYVVRNRKGEYFRPKGISGKGDNWVASLKNAKIYTRLGPARARVSFWAKHSPGHGVPELVRLVVSAAEVVTEERLRAQKRIEAAQRREARARVRSRAGELDRAHKLLAEAERNLKRVEDKG